MLLLDSLPPRLPTPLQSFVFGFWTSLGFVIWNLVLPPGCFSSTPPLPTPLRSFEFGFWNFFGICDLEFGASSPVLLLDSSTPPLLFGHSYLGFRICLAAGRRVCDLMLVIWCLPLFVQPFASENGRRMDGLLTGYKCFIYTSLTLYLYYTPTSCTHGDHMIGSRLGATWSASAGVSLPGVCRGSRTCRALEIPCGSKEDKGRKQGHQQSSGR